MLFRSAEPTTIVGVTFLIGVASLIIAIISKKDRIIPAFVPLLIVNILLLGINSFSLMLGLLKGGIESSKRIRDRETQELASKYSDVEYIKKILLSSNLCIGSAAGDYENTQWYFYDTDGAIVKQFNAIEFTFTQFNPLPELCSKPFYGDSYCTVTFFADYSGLNVESHVDGGGVGYGQIFYVV